MHEKEQRRREVPAPPIDLAEAAALFKRLEDLDPDDQGEFLLALLAMPVEFRDCCDHDEEWDGGDEAQPIGDDDAEKKRLEDWKKWREKIRPAFRRRLLAKGFTGREIDEILFDLFRIFFPFPNARRLFRFMLKWGRKLKDALDAYEEAKQEVGPPPPGPPPPPD